jgi:aspartate/methionine/tyrosine aminotransferase
LLEAGAIVRDRIRRRVAENLAIVDTALAAAPALARLHAGGGWSAIVRTPVDDASDEALVLDLLERDRVLFHPGYLFDLPAGCFVVVSLLSAPEAVARGIEALARRFR